MMVAIPPYGTGGYGTAAHQAPRLNANLIIWVCLNMGYLTPSYIYILCV